MPPAAGLAPARREWLRLAIIAFFTWLLQRLWQRHLRKKKELMDQQDWDDKVDLDNLQACSLTTVNLPTCGRIEKRTIMTKKLSEVFSNSHIRNMVLEAAEKTTDENPFLVSYLKSEDRWNVLVTALNHLSSVFGPYHLFSNQVSTYESCWFVFTLVGVRTHGTGRFFITPQHPLKTKDDVGVMRIRLVLVDEQELRGICSGEIDNQQGMFSDRHRGRWAILKKMADLFENQLSKVLDHPRGSFDIRTQSWGNNLCGTFKRPLPRPGVCLEPEQEDNLPSDFNNFLRIHVPVPVLKEQPRIGPQDCVLYE